MKTKPLDELMKEIAPIPFECYGPSKVATTFDHESAIGPTTDHAGPIAVVSGDDDAQSLHHAAYLTHAANILPELVEALEFVLTTPGMIKGRDAAMAALKKASTVEMP